MEGWVEDAAGEFGGIDTVIANGMYVPLYSTRL